MKRKLGRLFARVSGVLKRVWRWVFPAPIRTETQLHAPRPDERAPTVTPEVVDLEWEEIRAALAAEPSVTAAAPEAKRTVLRPAAPVDARPVEVPRVDTKPVEAPTPEVNPVDVSPSKPEPVPVEPKIADVKAEAPTFYKAPKYGREPKPTMAAPRPKPPAVLKPAQPVVEAKPAELEDAAVADLIARVDMFLNMGDLPLAEASEVTALEPELLVEEPTVRQQVVEQLIAEAKPVAEAPTARALSERAETLLDEASDEPFHTAEATAWNSASDEAVSVAEAVDAPVEAVATESVSYTLDAEFAPSSTTEAAREAERADALQESIADDARGDEPIVVAPMADGPMADEPMADGPMADGPMAAAPIADEPMADGPMADEPMAAAPIADEPIADEPIADEPIADEPMAAAPIADEPIADEPIAAQPIALAPITAASLPEPPFANAAPFKLSDDSASAEPPADDEPTPDEADDEPFFTSEETSQSAASDEAVSVDAAVDAPIDVLTHSTVEAVATETVSEAANAEFAPSSTTEARDAAVQDDAMAALTVDAPTEAPVAEEPSIEGDAAIDAELDAAMAQAGEALAAFATTHPDEAATATPVAPADDEPEPVDEAWSPPPVMADPYYEYAMQGDGDANPDEALADVPTADGPMGDAAVSEEATADSESPALASMPFEEPLPPEVAAMAAEEPRRDDESTIAAVTEAVEETLAAAADTLEAAADAMGDMSADADALAAAAMADVVAAAEAAEAAPPALPPPFRNPIPAVEIPNDYVATPESVHALYQVDFGGFEGPLDLLLHLIKRHHVDIFDIPIAFICERYLEHLKVMEDLDIDVASEFLFMASELLHLKSRMLLPRPEGETVDEEEVDPRAELVRRLLEYQKYKDVAERFNALDRFGRDTFGRDPEPQPPPEGEAPLKEVGLFALTKAFQSVLDRAKPEFRHQVMLEQVSVRARIRTLVQRFESQEPVSFDALLVGIHRRIDIVVTFLALLEMGKLKLLRIFQNEDGVIYVHPKFDDVSLAFARLEGLDESQYAG